MKRKEKEARQPRQLVFSTKKASRKTRQRQQELERAAKAAEAERKAREAQAKAEQEDAEDEGSVVSHVSTGSAGSTGSARSASSAGSGSARRHRSSGRSGGHHHGRRLGSGGRMRPSRALLQRDHISVTQCVKTMVNKKTDATLLVDKNGLLTGILTDRDIAFKVVAMGKDPKRTRVHEVMTPNPSCVPANASAIDALKKMISGQFRHLPVTDNDKVVGILDIAKCLYDAISKLEHAYRVSSDRLEETVNKLQRNMASSPGENLFETLRQKLFLPTLSAIITDDSAVPILGPSSTVMDAARLMLVQKTSAIMVCNEAREMVGIFTSKDLLRRVVAMDLDPASCVLSSVMTANPHSATLGTTILETLHSMHNGRFLHVPVFDADKKLVGLVDVLQVTCGVVQQMGSFQGVKADSVQPLWDQFRSSLEDTVDGAENEEEVEDDGSNVGVEEHESTGGVDIQSLIGRQTWKEFQKTRQPSGSKDNEVESTLLESSPVNEDHKPDAFVYKLADCYGNNHRFTSSADSLKELMHDVQNRLGDHTIRRVHYVDDEGEHVLLYSDSDLKDAVRRARMWGNKYIRLVVPHRVSIHRDRLAVRRALAHNTESALGVVYYAAAAAAIAGASFFLSRRK